MSLNKFLDNNNINNLSLSSQQKLGILQCALAVPILLSYYYYYSGEQQQQQQQQQRNSSDNNNKSRGGNNNDNVDDVEEDNKVEAALDKKLAPKTANLVVYGPSAAYAYYESTLDGATKVTKLLLTHFGKKAIELFIMSPGGKSNNNNKENDVMSVKVAVLTSAYYALGTYLVANDAVPMPQGMDMDYAQKIFWIGQFGESLHRYLLVESNKKKKKQKQQQDTTMQSSSSDRSGGGSINLPEFGLFKYVAAPHLLFEIITWIGIAGCARKSNAYVQAAVVATILAFQAKKLNDEVSDDSDDEEESAVLSRSGIGSGGGEPQKKKKKKRWNLIPYVY